MSRQPIHIEISDSSQWTPLATERTPTRHIALIARDGDVEVRRVGDDVVVDLLQGEKHEYLGIDLAQIEVKPASGASVQAIGSPF